MKKILLIIIPLMITAGFTSGCKNKPTESQYMGEMADDPKLARNNVTKLVRVDDLHVAFDFMSMPYHMQMMKVMHADMKIVKGATHGLMVTVMDYDTKKILKDASVMLSITDPDGKVSHHEAEIMSGAGMHHYAVHLRADRNGKYLISALIKVRGKTCTAKTDFESKGE